LRLNTLLLKPGLMDKQVFEKSFRINTYEADASGRLSIPALFNYLQDTAAHHAAVLGFGKENLEENDLFWVLSRILVKMDIIPDWEEKILIKTWPRSINGIFALRDFEIYGINGEKYGGASSCWLMLNNENRKPVRPGKMLERFEGRMHEGQALVRDPGKLPAIKKVSYTSPAFHVKYSDLDINMHANNVQYIKWALDTYPLGHRLGSVFESAEINYLAESLPGDEIAVKTMETGDNIFEHSLVRQNDGKELCRLRVGWKT